MNCLKKLQLFLLIFCLLFLFSACVKPTINKTTEELIGEWKGEDNSGKIASLIFHRDKSAALVIGNNTSSVKPKGGQVSWQLDTSKDPMQLDLTLNDPEQPKTLPMIIRFINKDQIEICIGHTDSQHPETFSSTENKTQIILDRQ